jgi:hypothetical protein
MDFESSTDAFVGFAVESGPIVESADGMTPATLPALPGSLTLCGITPIPERRRGLNNSYGFTTGQAAGAYAKWGTQTPGLTIVIRGGGALSLLEKANRVSGELPNLIFFVGVPGVWTEVFRFSKINIIAFNLRESPQGEAAEIEITLTIESLAFEVLSVPLNPSLPTLIAALSAPMFWHDVRSFTIANSAGVVTDFRQRALMGATAQASHSLERKGERNDWGHDEPLSRTNFELLEHNIVVTGNLQLHTRIAEAFLSTGKKSQKWGNAAFMISDAPALDAGGNQILVTLLKAIPQDVTGAATEPGAQLSHAIPFLASNFTVAAGAAA